MEQIIDDFQTLLRYIKAELWAVSDADRIMHTAEMLKGIIDQSKNISADIDELIQWLDGEESEESNYE